MEIMRKECGWIMDYDRSRITDKYSVYAKGKGAYTKVYFDDVYKANKYFATAIENAKRIHNPNSKWEYVWAESLSMEREDAVQYLVDMMLNK